MLSITKKIFIFLMAFLIFLNHGGLYAHGLNSDPGDLNGDTQINAMDLVYMQRFLLGVDKNLSVSVADVTLDGIINIIDLIRMKKYLSGATQKTYTNAINKTVSWLVFEGDSGFGIATPVAYRIYVTSRIYANKITYRHVYKVETFAYTYKNPNPEFQYPSIEIGTTKINNTTQNMVHSDTSIWVDPDWIWDYKTASANSSYALNANFSSVVSCMQNQAVYPLNTVENSFNF